MQVGGRNFLNTFFSLSQYVKILCNVVPINRDTHCKTTLRWLLRRGSPLPIPNREVKPACADGTAVMWESMSSPFFWKTLFLSKRGFLFYRCDQSLPLIRSLSFKNGKIPKLDFLFLIFGFNNSRFIQIKRVFVLLKYFIQVNATFLFYNDLEL